MSIEHTVDSFFRAWNATSDTDRNIAIQATWTDDGSVKDPLADVRGHEAIAGFIAEAVARFPGHTFRPSSGIDAHHDLVRFGWTLISPDGAPVVEGLEVATLGTDGRFVTTLGFFGPLPAVEEVAA